MPLNVPVYRHFEPRNLGYIRCRPVFGNDNRHFFPGAYNSPESVAAYRAFLEEHFPHTLDHTSSKDEAVLYLADRYLDHAKVYFKGGTHYDHSLVMVDCLRATEFGGLPVLKLPVSQFGPKALKAVREHMVTRLAGPAPKEGKPDKRTKTWSRTYTNEQVARVVRMFAWGVEEEIVPPAVVAALREVPGLRKGSGVARETAKVRPVDWEEVLPVLQYISPVVGSMVDLQWWTGMRSSNICDMRRGEIDISKDVWEYTPGKHKTQHHDKDLVVMLGPRAQQILAPFMNREDAEFMFSPQEADTQRRAAARAARKSSVQPSQQNRRVAAPRKKPGKQYDASSYRRAIVYAIKQANKQIQERIDKGEQGLSPIKWHPHRLRHTRGTEVRKRYKLEGTRVALGQSTVSAAEIYAEQDLDLARKIAREMG